MRGEKGKRRRKEGRKYYIYIIEVLRLAGYIDVTFLRRPRSHFFFFLFFFLRRRERVENTELIRKNKDYEF